MPDTSRPLRFALDASPGPWAAAQRRGGRDAVRAAVDRSVDLARIADGAGIDSIWVLEDPDGWDAFSVLGAMARVTDRVRLGTGVTNPYYRHPSLIAASVTTLDMLSEGRAFLGLGRGQAEWYRTALGMQVGKPARALAETVDLVRQWWSPEMRATSADGATEYAVAGWERVIRPVQDHVPVFIAAVGPLALRLAGRLADGVLFNDLASLPYMEDAIATVRDSARGAGRDPDTLRFHARTAITVTDAPEGLLERRKDTVAIIHALPGMDALLRTDGYDTAAIMDDVRRIMRTDEILAAGGGFGDLRRGGDLAAARRAIPTDLMRELTMVGSVSMIRARLGALQRIGVTDVFLAAPGPDATVDSMTELLSSLAP